MSEPMKPRGTANATAPPRPSQTGVTSMEAGASMPPKPVLPSNRHQDSQVTLPLSPRAATQTLEPPPLAPSAPVVPADPAPERHRAGVARESVKIHTFEDLLADLDLLDAETPADSSYAPAAVEVPPAGTPSDEMPVAKPKARGARAHRIPLALNVMVRGRVESHNAIHEETRTIFVLPHGAVLTLAARVSSGETISVVNLANGREAQCDVLEVQAGEQGKNQIEVEFRKSEPDFWPVSFPTEETEDRRRRSEEVKSAPAAQPDFPTAAVPKASEETLAPAAPASVPMAEAAPQAPPMPATEPASHPVSVASAQVIDLATLILADDPARPDAKPVKSEVRSLSKSSLQTVPAVRSGSSALESARPGVTAIEKPVTAVHPALAAPRSTREMFAANENESRSSKKWILLAVAATVLLATAVGGTIYLRRSPANSQPATANQTPISSPAAPPSAGVPEATANPGSTAPVNPPQSTATSSAALRTETAAPAPTHPTANVKTPVRYADLGQPAAAGPGTQSKAPSKSKFAPGTLVAALVPIPKAPASNQDAPAAPSINSIPGGIVTNPATGNSFTSIASVSQPMVPIPVGGQVQSPRRLSFVNPVYPTMARHNRVEGDVVIQAEIDANGKISGMKVVSGPAALQQAAVDALGQWKYAPGLLNGQPIASKITVTIQFRLQ